MISVGFDEQAIVAQHRGGVSRYFVELVTAFRADPSFGVSPIVGWWATRNEYAAAAGLAPAARLLGNGKLGPTATTREAAIAYLANAVPRSRLRGATLRHHTFYHSRFLAPRNAQPRVVTIYDMIPEVLPELFTTNPHLAKREYVRRADLILCISASAHDDLVRVYGQPDAPVLVTPLGVDSSFRPGGSRPAGAPEGYVLFVGRRAGYKDFATLLAALRVPELRGVPLVAVGGGPFTADELDQIQAFGLAGSVMQVDASDEDMPRYYANAAVFVFPSRYEGFGLPTLEAMACGCPTVLARSSSLPEVGGEAARYFEPGNEEQLAEQLMSVLSDSTLRSGLRAAGLARAAEFTWSACATATANAYRLLA